MLLYLKEEETYTKEDLEKTGIDILNMSNFSIRPLNTTYK